MSNLAIIPARGGSKRIPRKNIKSFLGKPIIAYTIEAAIESQLFDKIIVSTDDLEIKKIAIKFGAEVPFLRSKKNSDDFATTYDVLEEVLLEFGKDGIYYENLCCLYPCAPFINSKNIQDSFNNFINNDFDSFFAITPFSFPIQRALKLENRSVAFFSPQFKNTRSQDLVKAYHDAGQFYWANIKKLLANKSLFSNKTGGLIVSELEAQDIDNEVDWKIAEMKYKLLQNGVS